MVDDRSNPDAAMPPGVIGFRKAVFTWGEDDLKKQNSEDRKFKLTIENDLFFRSGQLNLVVGPTGSGKTSLLMALLGTKIIQFMTALGPSFVLGEMHYSPLADESGFQLLREGRVAFVAQEGWVQSGTIKVIDLFRSGCRRSSDPLSQDNILFGSEFDEERYKKGRYFIAPFLILFTY